MKTRPISLATTGAGVMAVMQDWANAFSSCPDFEYLRDVLADGKAAADERRAARLVTLTATDLRLLSALAPQLTFQPIRSS